MVFDVVRLDEITFMFPSVRKLVLLPGMDGTGELFADFVTALPDTFETTTIKYPSDNCLGYSDLTSFVESTVQSAEPFVLLAESFSTPVAIHYASRKPPGLKGLVICAGFASSPLRGWRRSMAILLTPALFSFSLPRFALKFWLVGRNPPLALLGSVQRAVSSVKRRVLATRMRSILACDARQELGQIDVPILYIQATHDRLVPALCFEEILQARPQASLIRISAPHLVLQREPQMAVEAVLRFTRELRPGHE
jgi:pimeloyl-[acyl-carrier protein] methyl ester esterase